MCSGKQSINTRDKRCPEMQESCPAAQSSNLANSSGWQEEETSPPSDRAPLPPPPLAGQNPHISFLESWKGTGEQSLS